MIYEFDDCELDVERVTLRRDGQVVKIEPQVFDLLCYLIERRGQVVSKVELLDNIWGDRFVSESALTSRIKSVRRAVGDDGTSQRVIRTVHRKGYEFTSTVTETDDPAAADAPGDIDVAGDPGPTLPLSVNRLIGRERLLDRLVDDLGSSRLVTVVGPAGVGKTTVALELARRLESGQRDGAFLVELVTVGDREAALAAVATTLDVNIRQQTSLDTAIVEMLRPRRALVVFDNCEHLVEPIAELVDRILRTAPGIRMVATSREPLSVAGERVHVVEPLDVAGLDAMSLEQLADVPAVTLFVERARAVDSRFELGPATAPAVSEICRRLDGIPLALELAASRTHAIDVTEIARRLDERLRFLKGVRRGADPRHSTLADAISWSYDLLDEEEQRLFNQLAVFAGSFNLDAAESICGGDDVLDGLTRLSQRSMLAVRRSSTGGTRYEMLETLREFAQQRLHDSDNVSLFRSHARHFATLASAVGAGLQTIEEAAAMRRADRSFADLRAAQRFAVEVGDTDIALELITSIREYAMRGLRYEVFSWADAAAAELGDEVHPLRPVLTALRAYGGFVRGEFDGALALVAAAAADEDAQGLAPSGLVERTRANLRYARGESAAGLAENARLVEIADESGNPAMQAHAYYMCSIAFSSMSDDDDEAHRLATAAFAAARRSGSPTDLASAWMATGFGTRDDDEGALDAFASADRLARTAGNRWMSTFARTEASALRVSRGDLQSGCQGLAETVDVWYRAGEWAHQWLTLSRCVIALDRVDRPELAAEVFGAIEAHTTVVAPPVIPTVRDLSESTRASLIDRLGDEHAAALWHAGSQLPIAAVVERTRRALLGLPDAD